MEVVLAETSITFDELQSLRVGDLITTSKSSDEPVLVSVGGSPKFDGMMGSFRGNRAVLINGSRGQAEGDTPAESPQAASDPAQASEGPVSPVPGGLVDTTG